MYKENALNLYFRKKETRIQEPTPRCKPRGAIEIRTFRNPYTNTTYTTIVHHWPYSIPRSIPEHPSVTISKNSASDKACQTIHMRYPNWPEIYSEPFENEITPNKHYKRVASWSYITNIGPNEKGTQTSEIYIDTTTKNHYTASAGTMNTISTVTNTCDKKLSSCSPSSSFTQLQIHTEHDLSMGKTMISHGGSPESSKQRAPSTALLNAEISLILEQEVSRMAQILGSLEKSIYIFAYEMYNTEADQRD